MSESMVARISRVRALRKCVGRPLLRVGEWIWSRLPSSFRELWPISVYGSFLHLLVRLRAERNQYHGTYFLRNRPEIELIRSLSTEKP